jgi:lipid-A-disaccharide synthase-like uncharacterized protein
MARSTYIWAEVIFILIVGVVTYLLFRSHPPVPGAVAVDVRFPNPGMKVFLQHEADGKIICLLREGGGAIERLLPDQLVERLYGFANAQQGVSNPSWLLKTWLQIKTALGLWSPVVALWLGIGFFGQILFTGRMLVQWLASERSGKSVVPPLFWWMSLAGSLLLLGYFLWRRDPIGLIGQAFGSFIYLKNILWIRNEARLPALAQSEGS